jgi:hypothetical protein
VRLLDRLDRPEKQWKFNPGDIEERMLWPKYQDAYQVLFESVLEMAAAAHIVRAIAASEHVGVGHRSSSAEDGPELEPPWTLSTGCCAG